MIKEVIKKYNSGELNNDTDEKYAGGFWDLAGDISFCYRNRKLKESDIVNLQEAIYVEFTEMYRIMRKKTE